MSETLIGSAREYAQNKLGNVAKTMTDLQVMDMIENFYTGGWSQFKTDNPTTVKVDLNQAIQKKPEINKFTLHAQVQKYTGHSIRLGLMDEIVKIEETEKDLRVLIKVHKVREQSNRWTVEQIGLKSMIFRRISEDHFSLSPSEVETIWTDDDTVMVGQYVRVRTPEYVEDQLDQVSTCYRPGSSRAPLSGQYTRENADEEYIKYWNEGILR